MVVVLVRQDADAIFNTCVVVKQIQTYMGHVKKELTEEWGVIIVFEDSVALRRALSVTTNIEFMT
jgi:hypothetical protein